MAYTESELLKTVGDIKQIVASDNYETADDALAEIANVIKTTSLKDCADSIKSRFEKEYYNDSFHGPQLNALELALGEGAASPDLKYLAAAWLCFSPNGLLAPDDVEPEILAICNIVLDEDEDDDGAPEPKPRWIREWGRRPQHQP